MSGGQAKLRVAIFAVIAFDFLHRGRGARPETIQSHLSLDFPSDLDPGENAFIAGQFLPNSSLATSFSVASTSCRWGFAWYADAQNDLDVQSVFDSREMMKNKELLTEVLANTVKFWILWGRAGNADPDASPNQIKADAPLNLQYRPGELIMAEMIAVGGKLRFKEIPKEIGFDTAKRSKELSTYIRKINVQQCERSFVTFWDHGAGWVNFGTTPMLTLADIREGLADGRSEPKKKYTIVAFDACLMQTYSTLAITAQYSEYVLASQHLVPGRGFDYDEIRFDLDNPVEVAKGIIDAYAGQSHAGEGGKRKAQTSMTLVSSDGFETFNKVFSETLNQLLPYLENPENLRTVILAFTAQLVDEEYEIYDLGAALQKLAHEYKCFGSALTKYTEMIKYYKIYYKIRLRRENSAFTGVGIWFPESPCEDEANQKLFLSNPPDNIQVYRTFVQEIRKQSNCRGELKKKNADKNPDDFAQTFKKLKHAMDTHPSTVAGSAPFWEEPPATLRQSLFVSNAENVFLGSNLQFEISGLYANKITRFDLYYGVQVSGVFIVFGEVQPNFREDSQRASKKMRRAAGMVLDRLQEQGKKSMYDDKAKHDIDSGDMRDIVGAVSDNAASPAKADEGDASDAADLPQNDGSDFVCVKYKKKRKDDKFNFYADWLGPAELVQELIAGPAKTAFVTVQEDSVQEGWDAEGSPPEEDVHIPIIFYANNLDCSSEKSNRAELVGTLSVDDFKLVGDDNPKGDGAGCGSQEDDENEDKPKFEHIDVKLNAEAWAIREKRRTADNQRASVYIYSGDKAIEGSFQVVLKTLDLNQADDPNMQMPEKVVENVCFHWHCKSAKSKTARSCSYRSRLGVKLPDLKLRIRTKPRIPQTVLLRPGDAADGNRFDSLVKIVFPGSMAEEMAKQMTSKRPEPSVMKCVNFDTGGCRFFCECWTECDSQCKPDVFKAEGDALRAVVANVGPDVDDCVHGSRKLCVLVEESFSCLRLVSPWVLLPVVALLANQI